KYSHKAASEPDNASSFVTAEGKLTRIAYAAPQGRSTTEVFRNYEQALTSAGFKITFTCQNSTCDSKDNGRAFNLAVAPPDLFGKMSGQYEDQQYLLGTLTRPEGNVTVSLYATRASKLGGADKDRVFTNLVLVEEKAMQGSMVKVDAAAMEKGLDKDGHIALYELYFDTGKADLKPESESTLVEIARLLSSETSLKILIVGHTDNVGDLSHNKLLSERRAQSVIDALVSRHGVSGSRLTPVGVGMAAPVAGNDNEAGRAKNRRVELVKR
ncbi:MAG: OmpA family protein, partial [Nevskiales bacterium]